MKHHTGQVEVICGSMFCGKTEELIRRARRAAIAKQKVQVFKPALDNRYVSGNINSHSGLKIEAHSVDNPQEILELLNNKTTVVAIDEAQFFDDTILKIVDKLAAKGVRVMLAGLDMDFRGEPFGHMPELLCRAEYVTKLQAICVVCGDTASRTQRLVNGSPAYYDDPIIMVGAEEAYEARCRQHHSVPKHSDKKQDQLKSTNNI